MDLKMKKTGSDIINSLRMVFLSFSMIITCHTIGQSICMSFPDISIEPGSTTPLTISMDNSMNVAGWQFKLVLPEGISIAKDNSEKKWQNKLLRNKGQVALYTNPSPSESFPSDGGYTFVCFVMENGQITGNNGEIIQIMLQASDNYSGSNTIELKDIHVCDKDALDIGALGAQSLIASTTAIRLPSVEGEKTDYYSLGGHLLKGQSVKGLVVSKNKKIIK